MKTAYTTHGLILWDKDLAIVTGNKPNPIEIEVAENVHIIQPDTTFVEGNFNTYDEIEVSFSFLGEGIDISDITQCSGFFCVAVQIFKDDETDLQIKDRNFKLEDLSMELQKRIHDVAEKMRADKMKFINY